MDQNFVSDIDEFNFKLTPMERASPVWLRLKDQLERRLAMTRRKNDMPMLEQDTAMLRGEIRCLKSILDFGAEPPPIIDGGGEADTPRRRARQVKGDWTNA